MPSLDYQPQVLVNTSSLSREEWLEYRRRGIGGQRRGRCIWPFPLPNRP